MFRDLDSPGARSTVRTWLFAIERHRVLNAARSRRRARTHHARLPARRRLVLGAESLPRTRTALVLRFQQGFTFEEMADVCHEKPGTLQAQVARALPALRTCIEARTGGATVLPPLQVQVARALPALRTRIETLHRSSCAHVTSALSRLGHLTRGQGRRIPGRR